jgi:hypothetical protein
MSKVAPTKAGNSLLINLCDRRWTKRLWIVSLRGRGAESVALNNTVGERSSGLTETLVPVADPRLRPHSTGEL